MPALVICTGRLSPPPIFKTIYMRNTRSHKKCIGKLETDRFSNPTVPGQHEQQVVISV